MNGISNKEEKNMNETTIIKGGGIKCDNPYVCKNRRL